MPRMMVSRMRVRSLTWVTVRPESRRACARVAPMLMTHLHRSYRTERPGYGAHLAMPHHRSHRHRRTRGVVDSCRQHHGVSADICAGMAGGGWGGGFGGGGGG